MTLSEGPFLSHILAPVVCRSVAGVKAFRAAMRRRTGIILSGGPRGAFPTGQLATEARVLAAHHRSGGGLRLLLEGLGRVRITETKRGGPYPRVRIRPEPRAGNVQALELERLERLIRKAARLGIFPEEVVHLASISAGPEPLAHLIAAQLDLSRAEKEALLAAPDNEVLVRLVRGFLEKV